jgi:hypothetical protein
MSTPGLYRNYHADRIDRLIYELSELTADEIVVVEEAVGREDSPS